MVLLTPTPDQNAPLGDPADDLTQHTEQVRELAARYHVGLADSFAAFARRVQEGVPLADLMSWINHPNAAGHELVAAELFPWFVPEGLGAA